ncbi:uncharacterized protein DEA37_0001128 [Paragonimus westermani]|uniref:EF-hand domain-containing protein n=1 Tax=Paragonimus westermani TaxID=34504 RepID=A0A5J4NJS8_9TREM|nr:uncharacterized protein DEA37_0001128 [Paragonimus westermani]
MEALKKIDKDGSGTISCTELRNFLASIGSFKGLNEILQFINRYDTDGDGELSMDELWTALNS